MAQLLEYKCLCCGGKIEFSSAAQKMKCPFCDTEFEMETLESYDEALKAEKPDSLDWEITAQSNWQQGEADGISIYLCQSCGGEVVGDENTAATSCPFCGNPVVVIQSFAGELKPDYVIPFKLDKEAAKQGLRNHLKGKKLLPKVFKDENHIDEIKGVYVPFWLFDAEADANIRYKATKVNTWSDRNYIYTKTAFYSIFREGELAFNRVPVDGSTKIDDDLMESIEPFDFNEAVDFQTAYLAGFVADKYDVSAESSIERANTRIKNSTEMAFQRTVEGYHTVIPQNTNVRLKNGKAQYALYPVWLLNTTWNDKRCTFAMNGQTGKFVGNLPMDKKAFAKWLGILTGIFSAVIYGAMLLIEIL